MHRRTPNFRSSNVGMQAANSSISLLDRGRSYFARRRFSHGRIAIVDAMGVDHGCFQIVSNQLSCGRCSGSRCKLNRQRYIWEKSAVCLIWRYRLCALYNTAIFWFGQVHYFRRQRCCDKTMHQRSLSSTQARCSHPQSGPGLVMGTNS